MTGFLKIVTGLCYLFSILNILQINVAIEGSMDFDYDKPEEWKKISKDCGGSRQSPIDVSESDVTSKTLEPLSIKGMSEKPSKMILMKIKYEVHLLIEFNESSWTVTGGPLKNEYKMGKAFIHWGAENGKGSEHSLNGKTGSVGLNFMAYESKIGDYESAMSEPDGLVGFAKIVQVNDDESKFNPGLKALMAKIDELKSENSSGIVELEPFPIGDFMEPEDLKDKTINFLTYDGSMLVPPCRENVKWFINTRPTYVPQQFVDSLRELSKHTTRPLQQRNDRKIYKITANVS